MHSPLFLRVHSCVEGARATKRNKWRKQQFAPYALIIDTETTIDTIQKLILAFYRCCALQASGDYICLEEDIFYAADLDQRSLARLRAYVRSNRAETAEGYPKRIRFYSRSEFIEKVFFPACNAGAVVVAFGLAFDLARLAVEYRIARAAGGRGWSFILSHYQDPKTGRWLPNTFRPRIQLRPKDSKAAFIRLAGGQKPFRSGRFLDLKTFTWALRNRSFSLESACREFQVAGKLDHVPSGRVIKKEIEYCRQDVRATQALRNALLAECFDNGNVRCFGDDNCHSRGQTWTIDEETMTATPKLNVDLGNFSDALGSAERLPNGTFVFTSGSQGTDTSFGQSIEVLPDGTKEYVLEGAALLYRSYRMTGLYRGIRP
jgi:Arylsulfotransferase (ASST)